MDEMKELVTVEQAERAILLLAVALPTAGTILGLAAGALRRRLAQGVVTGLLCGMIGPAVLGMWRVYNAVTERYGLDSVKALLINLAVFAALGAAIGLAVGYLARRDSAAGGRPEGGKRRPSV